MNDEALDEYIYASNELYDKLRLLTYPIGIKYISDESQIPNEVFQPSKLGMKFTLCQSFTMARRYGRTVAMTFADNKCITSSFLHGWEEISEEDLIHSQVISGYHKNEESERRIHKQVYDEFLNEDARKITKNHKGFIVCPLKSAQVIPDTVLIYGDPAQMTHIAHALAYEGKFILKSSFAGYGESCLKGGLLPLISDEPQLVLCGTGDRILALTKEEEMAIGLPAQLLLYVNKYLLKAGGPTNMGQPVRFALSQIPGGPPAWEYLDQKFKIKKI